MGTKNKQNNTTKTNTNTNNLTKKKQNKTYIRVRGWGPARRYVIPGCVGLGSCGCSRVLVPLRSVPFRSVLSGGSRRVGRGCTVFVICLYVSRSWMMHDRSWMIHDRSWMMHDGSWMIHDRSWM